MHNNFSRVMTQLKRCRVSPNLQVFIPLYRGMKDTLESCQHIKESLENSFILSQNHILRLQME